MTLTFFMFVVACILLASTAVSSLALSVAMFATLPHEDYFTHQIVDTFKDARRQMKLPLVINLAIAAICLVVVYFTGDPAWMSSKLSEQSTLSITSR